MPDEMDRAVERVEAHREAALAAVIGQPPEKGTPDCQICGEPIPERRRKAMPSARHCRPCQEAQEKPRVR
jgi:phage/conjugal plasmid C-4 type zinc finger TraR family protein